MTDFAFFGFVFANARQTNAQSCMLFRSGKELKGDTAQLRMSGMYVTISSHAAAILLQVIILKLHAYYLRKDLGT